MHVSFGCILNLVQWGVLEREVEEGGDPGRRNESVRKQRSQALPALTKKRVLRHVIEVLRSLRGMAVGAALCKALEAARSSPSSIRRARVGVDYRLIRIIRGRRIPEEIPAEERSFRQRTPTLRKRKNTTRKTKHKGKIISRRRRRRRWRYQKWHGSLWSLL